MSKKVNLFIGLITVIPLIALHIAHYFYDIVNYIYIIIYPLASLKSMKDGIKKNELKTFDLLVFLLMTCTYVYSFWEPLFLEPLIFNITIGVSIIMYFVMQEKELDSNLPKRVGWFSFFAPLIIVIIYSLK